MFEKLMFRSLAAVAATVLLASTAWAVTITHGTTTIDMDFVTVGDVDNAADTEVMTTDGTTGYGAVGYSYNIGKYAVSSNQWYAVSSANTNDLLDDPGYWSGDQPVGHISWYEMAMFCTWLTSGDVTQGAYVVNTTGAVTAINRDNAVMSYGTVYVIPTEDEWYKAAYYDPSKPGYWDYPTKHDIGSGPDGIDFPGDTVFDAVFSDDYDQGHPNDVDNAGLLSAYGTMGQGGNAWEYNELVIGPWRGVRGGAYSTCGEYCMRASFRALDSLPTREASTMGFRVASIPGLSALSWDGGSGNWADNKWGGATPVANADMVINASSDDSLVTVDANFITGGSGPAASLFVGEEYDAKLIVASGVTLEVTGETSAGEFGRIAVDNGATLQTGTAVIEVDGRLISGVQGNTASGVESGVLDVQTADGLTLEDGAEAIQVDWLPLPPNPGDPPSAAASMFGGVYTVAKYTGTALVTAGTTTNADANIGAGYIKSVDYDVDVNGDQTLWAIDVELQPQGLGDTDLDADVDGDDLATFGLAWSPSGTDKTWFDGDFDFDGDIDGDDLAALGLAWAPGGISFPAGEIDVTAVPEPCTIIMLQIGALGLLLHTRRRR